MKKTLWNNDWSFSSDIHPQPVKVQLPHDAMQTEARIPGLKDGSQSGYYPGGVYTYEKELTVSEDELAHKTVLEFEGIYMNSSVYLNGEKLGGRIYGYSDFFVDLTGKLKVGRNTVKVVADNSQCANSRWYSGSGIYRDVWLHTGGEAYIQPDGLKVCTESIAPPKLRVRTDAVLGEHDEIRVRIGREGKTIAEGSGADCVVEIPEARLWSAETPELYEITAEIIRDGEVIDCASASTGIRQIVWDSSRGFQVNGETVKLRGGCVHHDNGFIGAAEYDEACLRRVRIMKEAGFNAVRIAHNPASKAMLRACDTLGMYVMNESFDTWFGLKSPYDYAMYFEQEWERDLSDMIRVSYNHPSVVMYSIGNEVYLKDAERAAKNSQRMAALCRKLDPSRAVTNALNPLTVIMGDAKEPEAARKDSVNPREVGKPSGLSGSTLANVLVSNIGKITRLVGNEKKMRKINGVMEPLDIVGYNYSTFLYEAQHKDYPDRVLVGSETFPAAIYDNWQAVKAMPWVTGDFLWTAWDYLGECGVGMVHYGKQGAFTQPFPAIAAGCCNIDLSGELTPQGAYCAVVYGEYDKPYLAIHPVNHSGEKAFWGKWRSTDALHSWSWDGCEGKTADVDVYSNAREVELFLNGASQGRKPVERCMANFRVPYAAGELKAVHYDLMGKPCGSDILCSAGTENVLTLSPEKETLRAGGRDLLYLPIELTDVKGNRKVLTDTEITVKVEGAATLLGLGSADLQQESAMPYCGETIRSFQGRALAVLRSGAGAGEVRVTVSAEGVEPAVLTLRAV
jgi:beta-galactosidase